MIVVGARTGFLLAALILAASSGCGGEKEAGTATATVAATTGGTGDERRYLALLGEWSFGLEAISGDCRASLVELAGEPPSARMGELADRGVAACEAHQAGDAAKGAELGQLLLEELYSFELDLGENQELPVRGGKTEESRIEPRFTKAATRLTGKPTEVRCWSERDWDSVAAAGSPYGEGEGDAADLAGFASVDDSRIHLAPDVCAPLVDLVYGDPGAKPDEEITFAVVALAHESRHRSGIELESETECYALQDARRAARLLGASAAYADALAELYVAEIYTRHEPPYFDPECKDGGKLDLRPESSVWP